jgi:hypothetical protein
MFNKASGLIYEDTGMSEKRPTESFMERSVVLFMLTRSIPTVQPHKNQGLVKI